ncbi:hypothetical protein TWF281_002620 [Arthrobotrys megalospora]
MVQPAPINLIPAEISFQILSYLTLRDLKEFSICSKSCRHSAIPLIFRSITFPSFGFGVDTSGGDNLETCQKMVESSKNKDGALYLARMDVVHALLVCLELNTVGQIARYFAACSEVLGNFHNLQTLAIIFHYPIDILNYVPDFHDRVFKGMFTHLSANCPGYSSLVGLSINLTVGCHELETPPKKESCSEGMEIEECKQFLSLNLTSEGSGVRNAPYPPSLEHFLMKTKVYTTNDTTRSQHFNASLSGAFCGLSIIQCSIDTLNTIGFDFDLALLSDMEISEPQPELPYKAIFPSVKTATLNLSFLTALTKKYSLVLKEFLTRFPNIEDLDISHRRPSTDTYEEYISYFSHLAAVPTVRKLRIYWPRERALPPSKPEMMTPDGLASLTRCLVENYGLQSLEEITFIRNNRTPTWEPYTIGKEFKARTCSVVRSCDGEIEVKVGEAETERKRIFDHYT